VSAVATLCGEPRAAAAVSDAIERCVRLLRERLGPRLVGIVLTGSFSRGEGTVVAVDGRLRVLGDVEFLVILPRDRDHRALRPALKAWGPEVSAALATQRVDVDVEFGSVDRAFLDRRARPSIFVYDLRTHGRVLWGPADLLARIPRLGAGGIPREDAVHLLFNRAIEQLEAWDRLATALGDEALLDVAYQRIKLTLDVAGSALTFAGRHASSYAERPRAFAALLADTPALAARLPETFTKELARAARAKLHPSIGDVLPGGPAEARRARLRAGIAAGIPALAVVLRWELAQLVGGDAPLPALLERWVDAQPWRHRARGWVKLARHPLPAPRPLSVRRATALAARSTPRALVHAAGATAYLALADDGPATGAAARLLPLAGRAPTGADDERAAITAFWRWGIRND
jgi:predicted nucleotidyltransferase